jgi:pimeloyl-ACP methyl ester carboxylesterase
VPDLIGFGKSSRSLDAETLHANGQADALVNCLDALSVPRAILVGHDFGGPVALTVWARFPNRVAGIGLLSTNAFADAPIPFPLSMATWPFLGRWARGGLFSAPALRWMLRIGLRTPGVTVDSRAAIGDRHQALAIATIFSASLTRLQELYGPVQEALRSLSVPAFVAWGDCDPFFSVEQGRRTALAIPDSRFSLLNGAGHFLAEERPDDVATLITALASRVGRRDGEVAAANSPLPPLGPSDGAATTRGPGANKIPDAGS